MIAGPNNAGTVRRAQSPVTRANLLSFLRTGGAITAPTGTGTQPIGGIEALGYDTTWTTTPNASVMLVSGGLWSATSHPAYITFSTTAINSVTLTEAMRVSPNGNLLVGTTTDPTGAGAVVCATFTNGNAGPTWTSGGAVPAATQPKGSLYTRTGGAVGSTLYVSQGAGTWNAVAGV